VESLDGRTIYFSKQTGAGSIWKMPVEGGQETQLAGSLYRFNFAVAKQGIYYMTASQSDGTSELKLYRFATGTSRTILPIKFPELGMDVSPSGRYLAYTQVDEAGSDLMLVENFH